MTARYLKAIAVYAGTVIGVGLFGLPYVAAQSGFVLTILYLFILVPLVLVINLMVIEIACATKIKARIPGYIGMTLGKHAKNFSFISSSFALFGAQLAYLIIGGSFLFSLLSPVFGGG